MKYDVKHIIIFPKMMIIINIPKLSIYKFEEFLLKIPTIRKEEKKSFDLKAFSHSIIYLLCPHMGI